MPNSAIELHDSAVTARRRRGGRVVLHLDAYVHVSDGEPGVDPGSGRPVAFTVYDGI